ncbi:11412_t:CDS:2, partial [Rhizophagus irregularis]
MHSYNPLEKADTIAIIIQKLPLEHEFRQRWKIQVLEYYKLGHEEEKLEYLFNWDVVSEEFIERETEIAKKQ